jgi:hypothetical protein
MPSNTAAPPEEEAGQIVFRSPDANLILIRRPGRSYQNERGEQISVEGKRYEFEHGTLTGLDPDDVEWLRNHENFNLKFTEVGNEPDRERPSVPEVMTEITKAAARRDAEAIAAIYQREIESYDRDVVKETASQALAALEELADEEGAQPAEEQPLEA